MSIGVAMKTNRTEFWKSYRKGSFKKKQKKSNKNVQVLRLQAAIITQWLQIARDLLPNDLSTRCLVSIFTVRINSKSFPWAERSVQET